tara:strand:- start:907 stop:1131 length:225 start_codon:yes stop_codon:yes gene_type:complete
MMRLFLFKIFFRLTWWLAPDRARVGQMCDIYLKLLETERQKRICEKRQAEMDACVRPRTYPTIRGGCKHTDYYD